MPQIRIIQSSGSVPTITQLPLGDIAINSYDGKAYIKQASGSTQNIIQLGTGGTSVSASYASTASYAFFAVTASFAQNFNPSATASYALSASNALAARTASYAFTAVSSSYALTASTASYALTAVSASYATNALSSSYALTATTASYALNTVSASFASTASYVNTLNQDVNINGNLTVTGTASFTYVTGSVVKVGSSTIILNTDYPAIRFGGMTVIDSGSFGNSSTGSILWDSLNNRWIYSNPSGSSYDGGMFISGPRNTSGLGNEQGTTLNALVKGQGGDHITSSGIFEDSSGNVGIGATGSALAKLEIVGNVYATSFTGSFFGTASNAISSSYSTTASYVLNAVSASFATTASYYKTFPYTGSALITGSLGITGSTSITSGSLSVYKSGSTVVDIQGSQGQLFSVTDALSGSLMSVNDVSGLPILEVFSDDRVVMGTYGAPGLIVTGSTIIATGSLFGTASYAVSASTVFLSNKSTDNVDYPLIFKGDTAALDNYRTLAVDTAGPYYNPLKNTLGSVSGLIISASSFYGPVTGSLLGTASYADNAKVFPYTGSAIISGSLTVEGNVTVNNASTIDLNTSVLNINAPTIQVPSFSTPYSPSVNVRTVMYDAVSNVLFVTSSLPGGGGSSFTGSFTGSLTGSLLGTASYAIYALGAGTANSATSASYALSASYSTNTLSSSYALTATSASYSANSTSASYALTATTASYVLNAVSASYSTNALSSSYALTASFYGGTVTSASFASTASSVNALSQSVLISGSLTALTVEPANISTNYFPKKSGTFLTSSVLNSIDDITLNWGPPSITPTTPSTRDISVYGLNYASILLKVSGSTGNDGYMMGARPGGSFALTNIANNTQVFTVASDVNVQALAILGANGSIGMGQNGGNVGINWPNIYTIPTKFYVSGSVRFDGVTTINGTGTTSATTALAVRDASASPSLVVLDDGNVGIGTATPVRKLHVYGDAQIDTNLVVVSGIYNTNYYAGGPTATFFKNSVGADTVTILESGLVGIGTITPTAKLEVNGNVKATSFTGSLFGTASYALYAIGAGAANSATSASYALTASYAQNFNPSATASYALQALSASYALTATTASYALNALSSSYALTATTASYALNALSSSYALSGSYTNFALTASYALNAGDSIWTGSGANIYYNLGNVGIGTTNPGKTLDITGEIRTSGRATFNEYVNTGFVYGSSDLVLAYSGGTTGIIIKSSTGNVGIGTDTPGSKLDVRGRTNIWGTGTTSATLGLSVLDSPGSNYNFYVEDNGGAYLRGNVRIGNSTDNGYKLDVDGIVNIASSVVALRIGGTAAVGRGLSTDGTRINGGSTDGIEFTANNNSTITTVFRPNGNVGIGTTSPAYLLDVAGVGNFRNIGAQLVLNGGFGAYEFATTTGNAFTISLSGTAERMRILSDGNVGINTLSPGDKLEVVGNVYADAFNSVGTLSRYNSTGGIAIAGLAGNPYAYISAYVNGGGAGKNLVLQPSSGSVGIGTTNPAATLEVSGNVKAVSFTGSFSGSINTAVSASYALSSSYALTATTASYALNALSSSYALTATTASYALNALSSSYALSGSYTNFALTASYALNAGDSVWTGSAGNIYYNQGNVGIGTTSPSTKLHVVTTGNTDGLVQLLNGDSNYGATTRYSRGGNYNWDIGIGASATNNIPYSYFGIADGGITPRFVIAHTTGYVGIGTTNPSSILDTVVSSGGTSGLRFRGYSDTGTPYLLSLGTYTYPDQFQINSVNGLVTMGIVGAAGANPDLAFQTNTTERMRITTGGNVGIGTASPSQKLHVEGSVKVRDAIYLGGNTDVISPSSISGFMTIGSNQPIRFTDAGSTEFLRITTGGNVGIGTTNPATKLDVYGSTGVAARVTATSSGTAVLELSSAGATKYAIKGGNGDSSFRIDQDGTDRVTIASGGNVGIGTTSPSKKLEVASSDIKVNDVVIGRGPGTVSGGINHNIAFGVSNYSSSYAVADRAHIAIGYNAFKNLTAGYYSIAIGGYSLDAALEPDECIAIGLDALGSATYPGYSVAIGNGSLFSDTEGYGNVAVGARAGNYLNSAFGGYGENTLVGNSAAQQLKNARETTAIGAGALFGGTLNLSRANTAVGSSAGGSWVSGSYNVWLGYSTNGFISGSNNVIIGSRISTTAIDGAGVLNNSIVLADGAGNVRLFVSGSGNTGIGTVTPTQKLDVAGAISVSGSVIDYEVAPALVSPGPPANIVSFVPGTTKAAFVDYVIVDSSGATNQRVGTIMISINLNTVSAVMNEVTTLDIGNTSAVTFAVSYGAPTWLTATNSGITPYDISYMVRYF